MLSRVLIVLLFFTVLPARSAAATQEECCRRLSDGELEAGIHCYLALRKENKVDDPITNIWRAALKTQKEYEEALGVLSGMNHEDAEVKAATAELLICRGIEEEADGEKDASDRDFEEASRLSSDYHLQRYVIGHYWRGKRPARIVQAVDQTLQLERKTDRRMSLFIDRALANYWMGEPSQGWQDLDAACSLMWALPDAPVSETAKSAGSSRLY